MHLLPLALLLTLVTATPNPANKKAPAFCDVVKAVVTGAKQQSPATTFCSSYLGIATSTVTSTSTPTSTSTSTVTSTTSIVTETAETSTVHAATTTVETMTEIDTSMTTVTTATLTVTTYVGFEGCAAPTPPTKKVKRAAPAKPLPSCFKSYSKGALLSSACKCLSIPTPSTTVAIAAAAVTTTVTTTTSVVGTSTTTPITTVTDTSTTTVTTTSTTVSTTTAYPIATYTDYPRFQIADGQGNFIQLVNDGGSSSRQGELVADRSLASGFSIDGINGQLRTGIDFVVFFANQDNGVTLESLFFNNKNDVENSGRVYATCSYTRASDGTCPLTCTVNGSSQSRNCANFWYYGTRTAPGCSDFQPYAVGF